MRFVGVIIALALALVAGIAVLYLSGGKKEETLVVDPKAAPTNVQTKDILVAAKDIPVGTTIADNTFFDRQPWPQHLVLEQFIGAESAPSLIGTVTRGTFLAREPLTRAKLANPNDPSFLAAMLPEGMRVVTISTDAVSGLAGFVFPGDRVDVLFTHDLPKEPDQAVSGTSENLDSGQQETKRVTEVLASDIKILAVDQKSSSTGADQLKVPTTVSVEVTAEDAQRIRLAERRGTLALALRSLKDKDVKTEIAPTQESDISSAKSNETGRLQTPIIVVRGAKVEVIRNTATPSAADMPAPLEPTEQGNR